jgi:hypothetical protein
MDWKTGILAGTVITLSVAVAIILAEKYPQKQLAKTASTSN